LRSVTPASMNLSVASSTADWNDSRSASICFRASSLPANRLARRSRWRFARSISLSDRRSAWRAAFSSIGRSSPGGGGVG
jgi:hypothetical protein